LLKTELTMQNITALLESQVFTFNHIHNF